MTRREQEPTFELDHLFVCTRVGAPEGDRLVDLGLTEGEPNTHPGQGTANRRFFFRNSMLELLWVSDAVEAQSPMARRTRLFERWRDRNAGACPRVRLIRPASSAISPELAALVDKASFSITTGPEHHLEIGFDHERHGGRVALAPDLPITFYW